MASLISPLDDLHVSSNCSDNKLGTTVSKVCLHMHECPTGLRSQAGNVNTIRLVTHTQIELITLVGVSSKVMSVCMQHSDHLLTSQTTVNALCTRVLWCCVTLWYL